LDLGEARASAFIWFFMLKRTCTIMMKLGLSAGGGRVIDGLTDADR